MRIDQLVAFGGGDDAARSTREISAAEILSLLGMVGREHLDRFVDAILDRNPAEILRLIDEFFLYGQDSRELCGNLLEYFRNLLVVKTVADPQGLLELPATAIADLQRRAERVSAEELHTFFQLLSEVEGALRDSAYPRLLLEMTLLKMTTLPRLIPLSHLLDRLEALERSLGNRVAMSPPVKAPPAAKRTGGEGRGREERPEDKPLPRPPSDKEELWRQIVHKVRDRKISLGAILEEGQLLRIDDQILELGFQGENPFFRESVLSLENLKLISEVVAEVCGGRKKIKIGELSSSPPEEGTINNQEGRTLESPSPLEQEVLQDALELFGGRIVESRISEDSEEVISGSPFEESDTLDTEERDHG
ncbi:MAG: hypothetical protein D6736_14225 [Nitrospinota bacterium]|nr:MAG: hypothetical protein D6736_14225 [Nitrospinota bacterium]